MNSRRMMIVIGLSVWGLAVLACGVTPQVAPDQLAPTQAVTSQPTPVGAILPTKSSAFTATALPTVKATDRSTATFLPPPTAMPVASTQVAPTALSAPTPKPDAPVATPDPKLLVVTEAAIAQAVMSGAGEQQAISAQGLQVRFADGKMTVSAEQFGLGPLQVQNLVMVGRLTAQAGQLRFDAESVSPRGMVTALLPTVANQALAQFASQWYVEEVRTTDGRLELRIR